MFGIMWNLPWINYTGAAVPRLIMAGFPLGRYGRRKRLHPFKRKHQRPVPPTAPNGACQGKAKAQRLGSCNKCDYMLER